MRDNNKGSSDSNYLNSHLTEQEMQAASNHISKQAKTTTVRASPQDSHLAAYLLYYLQQTGLPLVK